jgi:16S rRNA (cytosine967-C5)-methyltransferase
MKVSDGPPVSTPVPVDLRRFDARVIAAEVIERVLGDAAFGAAALNASLERYPTLDERTRALTTELVYTTLRVQRSLRRRLEEYAPKGLPKDSIFLSHLLVAATQILILDHRTAPIAVDVAVTQVKKQRGPKMAGFANAVLRKLVTGRDGFDRIAALRESCPTWLFEALVKQVGAEEADQLLGLQHTESGEIRAESHHRIALRLKTQSDIPSWLMDAPRGQWSPLCRIVEKLGDPRKRDGYAEGKFVLQDEGAQLIALAVGAKSGDRVLDACAGRGQKTSLLAEQVAPNGAVCATDLHPRKLEALQEELDRLGLFGVTTKAVDFSRGSGEVTEVFDKALVDAPCTGTGTLRKRPEIAMRLEPADPARMGALSTSILRNVATRVRSGGTVVYAVCSVLPEEGEAVVSAVQDLFEPIPFVVDAVVAALGAGCAMGRLLPGRHGTDGYFLAHLRKK